MMLVDSGAIARAIPKSMSFSSPCTNRKFAGFRSEWTIPSSRMEFTEVSICCQSRRIRFISREVCFSDRKDFRSVSPYSSNYSSYVR